MCVPQLARDEQIFAGNAAVLDSLTHLLLIAIDQGRIDVPISISQRKCDCLSYGTGFGFPRA